MISATYFGEITELNSRAVWYSDEEDDDDDDVFEDGDGFGTKRKPVGPTCIEPQTHETYRAKVIVPLKLVGPQYKFSECLISTSSTAQYKHFRYDNSQLYGEIGAFGKVFAFKNNESQKEDDHILWIVFDSAHEYLGGPMVCYFVEKLRDILDNQLNLSHSSPITVISNQYSSNDTLEFLSNAPASASGTNPANLITDLDTLNISSKSSARPVKLPFNGIPLRPPSLIKSQFESALFEQLTLNLRLTIVVCLPNPKNFWFDKTKNWPSVPNYIIEHKLSDDSLEKTLIFS